MVFKVISSVDVMIKKLFFLQLLGFQLGPSRPHILIQPIPSTVRLAMDINNSVAESIKD